MTKPGSSSLLKLIYFLLIFASFEGFIRRRVPEYHQYILIFKDIIVILIYLLLFLKRSYLNRVLTSLGFYFPLLLLFFIIWNTVQIVNPYNFGLLPALIGFKLNLLYMPLLFVGLYISMNSKFQIEKFIHKISWIVIIVLVYALFQILTGFDTEVSSGSNDQLLTKSGGYIRAFEGGRILTAASTLYGGLLAPYGLIWFIISFSLLLATQLKKHFHLYILSISSLLIILIGNNRTAIAACLFSLFLMLFYQKSLLKKKTLKWIFSVFFLFAPFTIWILQRSEFFYFEYWFNFVKDIFNPAVRASITVNFTEGIKKAIDVSGLFGIGLGTMFPGVQYVNLNIDIFSMYGLYGTESIVHRMIIELGIIGLVLYSFIFVYLIVFLLKLFVTTKRCDKTISYIPLGAINLLLAYLLLAYKHHAFGSNATLQIYTFLFLGILIGITKRKIIEFKENHK